MLATLQIHNMAPVIYRENISPAKLLMYKPTPVLQEEKTMMRKAAKQLPVFSSLGLIIPFQPSMWDEKSIEAAWQHAIQIVQAKMNGRYSAECTAKVITRFAKLFARLNFNTHRESLVVILTPDEERLIYLSYPVKPVVFSGKSVSLLDLAANIQQEADFYYLVLNKDYASLYDYNSKQLRKVYEQNNETCPVTLFKKASNTIELMNSKYEKPVFVTGRPNLVEGFCNSSSYSEHFFTLLYHASPFSNEIIQSLVKEITSHWRYWQSKFIKRKILIAQKSGMLISNIDAVLKALGKCADGLLLVDKHIKHQLQKTSKTGGLFQLADEFMQQLEKFLARGNRIEITESGLLKDMGGIVLLQGIKPGNTEYKPYNKHAGTGGSLY